MMSVARADRDDTDRLDGRDWTVRDVPIRVARPLVVQHHYAAGAANTATYLHGLFRGTRDPVCYGVAWWIPPTKSAAEATFPENWRGVLTLSRLVIVPGVPKNACTFLLARSRRLIPADVWPCLVTYADEWQGHTGTIYKADNWTPCGMTAPERVYVIDGRMTARKAGGRTYTHAEMLGRGATVRDGFRRHKFVCIRHPRRTPTQAPPNPQPTLF